MVKSKIKPINLTFKSDEQWLYEKVGGSAVIVKKYLKEYFEMIEGKKVNKEPNNNKPKSENPATDNKSNNVFKDVDIKKRFF